MLESQIEAKVVAYCKQHGLLCYKLTSPNRRGVPDRLIMGGGRALFLELKKEHEIPTPLQDHEMDKLRRAGMVVAWSDSFEGAREIINRKVLCL